MWRAIFTTSPATIPSGDRDSYFSFEAVAEYCGIWLWLLIRTTLDEKDCILGRQVYAHRKSSWRTTFPSFGGDLFIGNSSRLSMITISPALKSLPGISVVSLTTSPTCPNYRSCQRNTSFRHSLGTQGPLNQGYWKHCPGCLQVLGLIHAP